MAARRNTDGRPISVPGRRITSFSLGRTETRILESRQRRLRYEGWESNRSHVLRLLIRASDDPEVKERMELLGRAEAEKQELARRLAVAESANERLQERLQRSDREVSKGKGMMARLLVHLPMVRDRAQRGLEIQSNIPMLDQVWHNAGRKWSRVVARLEEVQRRLGVEPPPDPGTTAGGA